MSKRSELKIKKYSLAVQMKFLVLQACENSARKRKLEYLETSNFRILRVLLLLKNLSSRNQENAILDGRECNL